MKTHPPGPNGQRDSSGCAYGTAEEAAEKGNAIALVRSEIPQGLKPELFFSIIYGPAEAVPLLQSC